MKEILEAAERIRPHVRRTPLLRTDLDDRLRLKAECFQLTGSFKARGAFNAVLSKRAADPSMKGVIAVSSGNHAQALALAARSAGLEAVIIIPADANPEKVQLTRAYGAKVIQDGVTFANREQRQLGYYVLLAAAGVNLDGDNVDVLDAHPHEPLAQCGVVRWACRQRGTFRDVPTLSGRPAGVQLCG